MVMGGFNDENISAPATISVYDAFGFFDVFARCVFGRAAAAAARRGGRTGGRTETAGMPLTGHYRELQVCVGPKAQLSIGSLTDYQQR